MATHLWRWTGNVDITFPGAGPEVVLWVAMSLGALVICLMTCAVRSKE